MSTKKKPILTRTKPKPPAASVSEVICLRPSVSDYETFARTTADAMGRNAPVASKRKPNKRLLSLLGLGA